MAEISIKRAAYYNAIAKYGTMIVQLGLTMILSRLIVPEDFGVVAIITVLIGFLNLFSDMGFGINVVQHPEMETSDINKLFSFSVMIGVILAIVTLLAAFPLASFYDDYVYYKLCLLVSFVTLFNSLNVVPNAILMRDKEFKLIAKRTIWCTIISGVVAVGMAFGGFGVYALVFQVIISSLFLLLWNYRYCPLKICSFKSNELGRLLGKYSLFQVLFNFLNYFTRNLDNILVGKYFGSASLAQYNKSYMLYLHPNNLFTAVITGVLHPYIREYKTESGKMLEKYMDIEKILSLIGIFTMMSFFLCSNEIVLIIFGNNWEPAGIYLKCLSLCMWTQMMSSVSGSIFLGLERTDQIFKCGIINLLLLLLSIFCGIYFNSMIILSLCVAVSYNLIFVITNLILVKKTMRESLSRFFRPLVLDGCFVFSFVAFMYILDLHVSDNVLTSLIVKLFICTIVYILYLFITKQIGILMVLKNIIEK